MSDPRSDPDVPVPYDAEEAYAAGDHGEVIVPEGTAAILYAQQLEQLKDAGF